MTTAGAIGSSAHESRTFDCPWCGAISPVPADHLGEHFSCPECRKQTKLTEKNTSSLHVTETPPDAPHLTGDRTFDCPWCGAISAVPSSHLGERFLCPECSRDTKLTSTNTRRAPITAPPPDAPPPAATTGSPRALVAVAVLAVVGVVVWVIASGSGEKTETQIVERHLPDTASIPPAVAPTPAGTAPARSPEGDLPPAPPAVVPTAAPPTPAPATEPPKEDEKALADTEWSAAEVAHAAAAAEVITANARVAAFLETNGDVAEASLRLPALKQALAEVPALAAGAAPDAIRAYDAAVAQALAKTPARADAAEAARTRMASEFHGRGVAGLAWKDLDYHSDAFHRAAAALEEAWGVALSRMPADLLKARDDAQRHEAEARVRLDRATERRARLAK